MALDTVQAVRQAELNAANKEKEALLKKESILIEAQHEAKEIVASRVKETQMLSEKKLKDANDKGVKRLEAAKSKADQEVLILQEMVKSKEQAAIDFIISSLI
jgi:vacuolar-type H+-ATPase subunit H